MLLGLISPDFVRYISGKPDVDELNSIFFALFHLWHRFILVISIAWELSKLLTPGQAHLQQNPSLKPSTSPFLSHRHTLRKVTSCTLHRLIYLQDQAALRSI
ncbi:hypothetical protein DTO271D3_597 [Paecilomyces variotii]|nr:hypothetical protein DTO271D3_597 [Paecilomyces variotii]